MKPYRLFEKIENCKPLDFGDIFSKSIDFFKKVWLQGFLHLLISFLVMLPLIFIMYIPVIVLAGISSGYENGHLEEYFGQGLSVGLMILFVILVLVISILASAVQFGITAHFYRVRPLQGVLIIS